VRQFIKTQIHVLVFAIMHGIFSLYIRTRQMWNIVGYQIASVLYYHHGTPQYIQKDVTGLARIPTHLSAILRTEGRRHSTDLERLIDETAELATWCACAEIPMLSIYEKSGGFLFLFLPNTATVLSQLLTQPRNSEEAHSPGLRGC
jgi:dehydrodolichyl diphosphate syntase complex subunit NUS1